jgi:hypothetical protein
MHVSTDDPIHHAGPSLPGVVIEWAPFRVREGVTEAALLDAAEAVQRDFLARQPGFLGRELARGADGSWADIVRWADASAADAAMAAAGKSASCSAYFQLMTGANGGSDPGEGLVLLQRLRAY